MASGGDAVKQLQSRRKIASIGMSNRSDMRKANGSEGSYFPVSIALTDCRDTREEIGQILLTPVALRTQDFQAVFHSASPRAM